MQDIQEEGAGRPRPFTLRQVAKRMGIEPPALSRIETWAEGLAESGIMGETKSLPQIQGVHVYTALKYAESINSQILCNFKLGEVERTGVPLRDLLPAVREARKEAHVPQQVVAHAIPGQQIPHWVYNFERTPTNKHLLKTAENYLRILPFETFEIELKTEGIIVPDDAPKGCLPMLKKHDSVGNASSAALISRICSFAKETGTEQEFNQRLGCIAAEAGGGVSTLRALQELS